MSVAAAIAVPSPPRWRWRVGGKVANAALAALIFLGAFVIDEPAPYELLLLPLIVIAAAFGLNLNRHFAPMVVLLLLYVAGGWLALTALPNPADGILYMGTTTLLAASAIFFAAVIAPAPEERLRVIGRAYIAGAAIAALLGFAATSTCSRAPRSSPSMTACAGRSRTRMWSARSWCCRSRSFSATS